MVRGLDLFREWFRPFLGSMALIGGAACDEWFAAAGLSFRATKDLDLVIMLDSVSPEFVTAMKKFVAAGEYKVSERSDGVPILYRFSDPGRGEFPAKLELSSRKPEGCDLSDAQKYIPVSTELGQHSLSAILLDEGYFSLIQTYHDDRDGLWVANATALIPLKAHAWLNLQKAVEEGAEIDSSNIKKHRADVFRLAATLAGGPGPELPASIISDLTKFLQSFPVTSDEWPAILSSLKVTFGNNLPSPADLRTSIQTYFRLEGF